MSQNTELNYKSALLYLSKFILPHKKWYLTASIISLVLVGTGLLNARVTQLLVDSSISGEKTKIFVSLISFILIITINITLNYISGVCVSKLSANASMDLKRHISKLLLNAKYGEIIKLKSGNVLSSVNSDTGAICDFIAGDLIGLFSQFTMALGSIIYLVSINPLLAVITFAYTPIGMFFTLSLNSKMNRLYSINVDYKGEALSVVEQALLQIPIIKSFGTEERIKKKIFKQFDAVYHTEMRISKWNSLLQTACSSTSYIPRIVYMIFSGYMVMRGKLTTGTYIAVFDLLTYIIAPSVYFPFLFNGLNKSIASMNRIKRLEDIPQVQNLEKDMISNIPLININNVSFGYSDNKTVIQGFSLLHKGTGIIAICGESGFGKTTLLDLIAGLYIPNSGSIEVGGGVSVVSQDTFIFSALLENVKLANRTASDTEIIHALKMAGADEFAKALPNGYNTMIGDGYADLSGGQKQRISFARTILSNCSIWLLDEPTSALDSQTENIIIDVLRRMSKEKLIIICAHRKSLTDIADRIITLKGAEEV